MPQGNDSYGSAGVMVQLETDKTPLITCVSSVDTDQSIVLRNNLAYQSRSSLMQVVDHGQLDMQFDGWAFEIRNHSRVLLRYDRLVAVKS